MSFKLSELLNPAPSPGPAASQLTSDQVQHPSGASSQHTEKHTGARLPTPKPVHPLKLDLSPPPPHDSCINQVAPIEPSTPVEHGSSSPTLDQYHLSPPYNQARRQSMANPPQLPPPTLAPIQPQYDISPPATRLLGVEDPNVAGSFPPLGLEGTHAAKDDKAFINDLFGNAPIHDSVGSGETRTMEHRSASGYKASEEIAALGLAALDGAQEGEEHAAVKTEAQSAPDLAAVPATKAASRLHRPANAKPSEGSSDKRFLCYICIKLFTRRRSVRDHIKKIHNDTNFDMARAIEVTVDPETGESVVPLAELFKTLPAPSGGQATQTSVPQTASRPASRASSVDTNTFSTPAPVAGKKRPAPDAAPAQSTAMKKKGTAKPQARKNGTKKAKPEIEISTETAMAFRSPSGTPVSSRASKPPTAGKLKKQPSMSVASSPAPSDRMSVAPPTDNEAEDEVDKDQMLARDAEENEGEDDEVFCICRKGDNHTWMIACDGGCEDWFHGRCVNIQERDGDLIDKYICPKCEDKGRGQTTWKRMCRRKECRKPARVLAEPPSKYCSDDCKKRFWVGMVKKSDPNAIVSEDGLLVIGSRVYQKNKEKRKRKRKKAKEDEEYHDTNNQDESEYQEETMKLSPSRKKKKAVSPTMTKSRKDGYMDGDAISSDDEPPLPTRGGALSVGDIKMMLNQAKTVDEIRRLGQKPPTPPYTSDFDADDPDTKMVVDGDAEDLRDQKPFPYNSEEQSQLSRLSAKKRRLHDQLQLLRDQEKLLVMVKTRSAAIIEDMAVPKAKNVCGFDARLSWSTVEFENWRRTAAGRAALEKGEIGDPADPSMYNSSGKKEDHDDDAMVVDGIEHENVDGYDDEAEEEEEEEDEDGGKRSRGKTTLRGICIRNKCPRHREWRRLMASEYKFEEEGVRRQIRKLDSEAREVRKRAALRVLCEQE